MRLRPYYFCVVAPAAIVEAVVVTVAVVVVAAVAVPPPAAAVIAISFPLSPPLLCAPAVHADIVVVLLLLLLQHLFINPLDDLKSDVDHRVETDLLLLVRRSTAVAVVPIVRWEKKLKIIVKTVSTFLGLQLVFTT